MQCAIEGCPRPVHVKRLSLCRAHYTRGRRYGDPLAGGAMRDGRPTAQPVRDHEDGTRSCNACDTRRPLIDFPKDAGGSGGYRTTCKPCHTAKQKVRYEADRERHKARIRQRRLDNIEAARAADKERYEREKPKRVAYANEQVHRRRALLAQVECDKGITIKALLARHGDRCCYCYETMSTEPAKRGDYIRRKATLEHLTPLSRGGTHTWDNVRLACWECNVRKNATSYEDWQLSRGVIPLRW